MLTSFMRRPKYKLKIQCRENLKQLQKCIPETVMLRALILTIATSVLSSNRRVIATGPTAMVNLAVEFEVYGRVQGVFFRKYTKQEADRLGLRGWCMNTKQGTVLGHLQGREDLVKTMMSWLSTKGSPSSEIERAEFWNQNEIAEFTFENFSIRK